MCNYRISIIFVSSWFFGFIVVDDDLGLVLKCGHHIDFSAYMIPNGGRWFIIKFVLPKHFG